MSETRRAIPHLFERWDQVESRVRKSHRVVIFLDFDGTLAPIAPHPCRVRVPFAIRRALEGLARRPRVSLIVLSGRRRAELRRLIGLRGIRYWGLYGWERGRFAPLNRTVRCALRCVRTQIRDEISRHPKTWIENKRYTLSIHLLGVPAPEQSQVRQTLRRLLRPFRKRLCLVENLRDAEIKPRSMQGKGSAVRRFLARASCRGALSVYIGDDLSDEEAFAAIGRGIAVHVGKSRSTRAQYRLTRPGEVAATLRRLGAALG
jgi:trehalose 6-phosphate phosphatase